MKMICDVPDEVIKSVRMGTWFGSSVLEKMVANGIPLDKIHAEIKSLERFEIRGEVTPLVNVDKVLEIIDKAERK